MGRPRKSPHDAAQGYSNRSIEVEAYGEPEPEIALRFYAGKVIGRKRGGYDEWIAKMEEQFKLQREKILMPMHRPEWRHIEIKLMVATKHKVKWGHPKSDSRTLLMRYVSPIVRALQIARLLDEKQPSINSVSISRWYAPASGVKVKIGVIENRLELEDVR